MAGGETLMNAMRAGITLVAIAGLGLSQSGQTAFEVVSIKPHAIPAGRMFFLFDSPSGTPELRATGNRFNESVATLQDLIMAAYRVKGFQILDMPDWVRTPSGEHYDIEAKSAGDGTPSQEQLRVMLQSL